MGCSACEQRRSAMEQAKHLAQSAGKVVKAAATGEQIFATKELQQERYLKCEQCDKAHRKNGMPTGSTILSGDRCLECGCPILRKIQFATESCPLGKW